MALANNASCFGSVVEGGSADLHAFEDLTDHDGVVTLS